MGRKPLLLLGAGKCALEMADLVAQLDTHEVAAFVESQDRSKVGNELLGLPVRWVDDIAGLAEDHDAVAALGSPRRRAFIERVAEMGFRFTTLVHPFALIAPSSHIGEGSIINAGANVAAYAEVGRHVLVNRGCLIGHDTRIGDYCTLAPGANVAGSVTIGSGTYVGMGALVLNNLTVGEHALIGAGAVVTRDVPDSVQVTGLPARITQQLA